MLIKRKRENLIRGERGEKGFTLIELLVVIAIIGLLSSVVIASLDGARRSARDAKAIASLIQIKTALEIYYSDNGSYPNTIYRLDNACPSGVPLLSTVLAPQYISSISGITRPGFCNFYYHRNSGQGFVLVFMPEKASLINQGCDPWPSMPGPPADFYYCVGVNYN